MNAIRPRLVTFDVTGTLLMTGLEVHYSEVGSRYGLSVDPRKLAGSFKQNFNKLAADHPVFGKHTGLGWENWWRTIVHNVFREQNEHTCEKALDKVASTLIECYSTNECWHKYPDTLNILDYLKKKNVVLGVISNFDARLESVLVSTELRPYFSFVLSSYDLGTEKPDPLIFEEALKITKRYCDRSVLPHEAVHIGDTYDKDYLGAKNAKWNAILIKRDDKKPTDNTKLPHRDVYRSLNDLKIHFDKVFRYESTESP
ncbi:rhythmically expressed gene 2 protein-like [Diprion similis]|uniref:rhythmically expressed gene 2 protein-like n=1 Tax=Diprion similis TaxID=362088 RepID=UPI001EF7903F|nr:rhythmically expressed gene 2 protein-like [Diprion similis]